MSDEQTTVDEAFRLADEAASAAGIRIRPAAETDFPSVVALFERTWGPGRSPDRSMLQAMDYAGNTVLIALDDSGPVGATLGFLGWDEGVHLHSHMNAVVPWRRSGGVGYSLKLLQRALCLEQGVTEMRWTFDPLIRRNAHFNLVKLGADVVGFLPDFYGRLDDAISGGDRTDRFEVRWRLASPRTARSLARHALPEWAADDAFELAPDFETLRADDASEASRLRDASRQVFERTGAAGLRPEFDASGRYVFTRDDVDREP